MTPVKSVPATKPSLSKSSSKPSKTDKPKVEEKKEGPNGATRGITWGLPLHQTFKRLLLENFKKKLTDDQMIEWLLKEFPNRENKNILHNMREIRWRFNFGKLDEDKEGNPHPPTEKSVPYRADGTEYVRVKKTGMTEAEKAMKIEERREAEIERRAAEVENLKKAEERVAAIKEKMIARQAAWEERNGKLPSEEKKPEAKSGKKIVLKKK